MVNTFYGVVQSGFHRGTTLGYPTINIPLNDTETSGIFAARVSLGGRMYRGAAYADQKNRVLEAYLLDFFDDAYGEKVAIELCEKIREDMHFDSEEALRAQIADDVEKVRTYFKM